MFIKQNKRLDVEEIIVHLIVRSGVALNLLHQPGFQTKTYSDLCMLSVALHRLQNADNIAPLDLGKDQLQNNGNVPLRSVPSEQA